MKLSQVWYLKDRKTLSLRTFIFERQYFGKRRRIVSISAEVTFNEVSSHKFTLTLPTLSFNPFFSHCTFSLPPENIRKPEGG